ncbi:hypothetical protein Poli38472_003556 [Pythium oligandrum]|uniref:Calcium-channel protein CCH1 n=1 Tax=Pythium oligandrum TaxID=41045 RepID=A0A8K1FCV0_PYTOL|nr:hypothetical protein Poli38472_003556 [Pythium oligandrum]|eukprot:TMW57631.1 hypothetical protein Poli38472_003556 [Pythium oligandrum]
MTSSRHTRVAAMGTGDGPSPERGSLVYRSVVDAVVSEEDGGQEEGATTTQPPSPQSPQRRIRRLSAEERALTKKTSRILTSHIAEVVLQSDALRVQQLRSKYLEHLNSNNMLESVHGSSTRSSTHFTSRWAPVKLRLQRFVKSNVFRAAIYIVVLLDMFVLALDNDASQPIFAAFDITLTTLLLLEIVLKSLAFGFFRGPNAYLVHSRYRVLNVALIVASLLSHLIDRAGGSTWRIFRGLKTFRALTLYAGLRRILKALLRAIPFLTNVSTLALFFLLAFSIFSLEAYRGAYDKQCAWLEVTTSSTLNDTLWTALPRLYCSSDDDCGAGRTCESFTPPSKNINFDSGISSLFLVFLVVAQDGWVTDIMEPAVEATSLFSTLFFVAIVASMVFLVVNLFVAVITTAFMNYTVEHATAAEGNGGHDDAMVRRMTKMSPKVEATRVSLIMGATLAIEESMQVAAAVDTHADGQEFVVGIPKDRFARALARTHKFSTMHDLIVETTLDLIQKTDNVDEFFARAYRNLPQTTRGSVASVIMGTARTARNVGGQDFTQPEHPPTSERFRHFQQFVLSKRFDDLLTVCILVNTILLLIEYPGMPSTIVTLLSVSEYVFGSLFALEMLLRIIALRGLRAYLSSTERLFDLIVVLCTSVNMVVLNHANVGFSGLNSVSSLRTLRVGRLMMKYEGTRKLIESVLKSSRGVVDVAVFMLLFQVVNAIVAMQIFGGSHLSSDGETPRWNFDTFGRSFLTLLQVITADQWSSIAYDAVDADNFHWFMVPFLIIIFILGQYVLLNLFIAVILENFSISEEEAYQLQLEQIIAIPKELDIYERIEEEGVRAFGEMEQLDNVNNVKLRMFLGLDQKRKSIGSFFSSQEMTKHDPDYNSAASHGRRYHIPHKARVLAKKQPRWLVLYHRACCYLTTNVWFSRLVQLMIFVSCVTLGLEDPHPSLSDVPPTAELKTTLSTLNRLVLAILILEFVVKVSSMGFGLEYVRVMLFHHDERLGYVHKHAYLEDRWNQLDFFLLVLTAADEVISSVDPTVSAARVFRAGRVLRPLRIVSRNHEMQTILGALARSLPQVGNVFALCGIVYIIFGVIGRSLFAGKFYSCNDDSVATKSECVGFFYMQPDGALPWQEAAARGIPSESFLVPRVWSNARFSFDHIGAAFLTLLEMTSLKWVDKAFAAMDITGIDRQPVADNAPLNALFFILFVYIGALFVIRLFVGVLVEQFQRNNGTQILTESQKAWVDLEKFVLLLQPLKRVPLPSTQVQRLLYALCQHAYFSRAIGVAILLNVVLLLFNPSSSDSTSSRVIELLFMMVFSVEAACKCLAFRQHYVISGVGAFELLILIGSLIAYVSGSGYHSLIQTGRVFRMLRVLRFVRLNRGVYAVFQTFRASLRPIAHIFFLLIMIFFIFAIVGRQLFGGVRFGPAMNHFSNFRNFFSSFVVLFQIMAGDDWHLLMTDCMRVKPFCVERLHPETDEWESDCGSTGGAVLFFATYVMLVVFVFLNLFIAVVLENFRSCYLQDDVCPISLHDFERYREVFMTYDVDGSGSFPLWQLAAFLTDLPTGLRVDKHEDRVAFLQVRSQVQALQESFMRERSKRPFFNELLRMLCIHQLGIRSLPYEQQRGRVKQIFIYRAKVANMLVEAVVQGYVQRWRQRKTREQMGQLRVQMQPERALIRQLSEIGQRRSQRNGTITANEEAPTQDSVRSTSMDVPEPSVTRVFPSSEGEMAPVVHDGVETGTGNHEEPREQNEQTGDVNDQKSPLPPVEHHRARQHHQRKGHKMRNRREHEQPAGPEEDHIEHEGHNACDTVDSQESEIQANAHEALVTKSASISDSPLHAPRRLPKLTVAPHPHSKVLPSS